MGDQSQLRVKATRTNSLLKESTTMEMKSFLVLAMTLAACGFASPQYPTLRFPNRSGGSARLTAGGSGVPSGTTGNYIGKQPSAKKVVKPSAESALAYMKVFFGEEDLCSTSGLAYLENILNGKTGAEANAAAEAAYKAEWAKGTRLRPGSACEKADIVFKESYNSGKDTILDSALAFVNAWPGLQEGNPCAVSGKAYMEAIIQGKSIDEAGLLSGKASIKAFGDLARSGRSLEDSSCAAAAKSFISASYVPDSASAESAKAFIDATLSVLHLHLPTWTPLPLATILSPRTLSLPKPSTRSMPKAPPPDPTHHVSRQPWPTRPRHRPRTAGTPTQWLLSSGKL